MLATEAPKITDWMQGWGSILGLLMSTVAVVFTGFLLRHERNVRREEKADSDLAQARLVVGRVSSVDMNPDGTIAELEYNITNYSDAPVFFVNPYIYCWDTDEEYDSERVHHVLRSGVTAQGVVPIDNPDPTFIGDDGAPDLSMYQVKFLFIDKNGLEWRRFDYEAPIRGFKDPQPTHIQRVRKTVGNRIKSYTTRVKYGRWSGATRRRKRAAAARRRGEARVDD